MEDQFFHTVKERTELRRRGARWHRRVVNKVRVRLLAWFLCVSRKDIIESAEICWIPLGTYVRDMEFLLWRAAWRRYDPAWLLRRKKIVKIEDLEP